MDDSGASITDITFLIPGDFTVTLMVTDIVTDEEQTIAMVDHDISVSTAPQGDCVTRASNETRVGYESCPIDAPPAIVSKLEASNDLSAPGQYLPMEGNWDTVLFEDFSPPDNADRSKSIDYKRWSTHFPYGGWRNNSAAGDDGWFVNTTGLEPGLGWEGNIYPDMELFITELEKEPIKEIYRQTEQDTLIIQAHTNPWKNKINGREDYLTGVISSHTDPARTDEHGFEFKYGYVEARM